MSFWEFKIASTDNWIDVNIEEIVYFTPDLYHSDNTVLVFKGGSVIVKESYNQVKKIVRNARNEYYPPKRI